MNKVLYSIAVFLSLCMIFSCTKPEDPKKPDPTPTPKESVVIDKGVDTKPTIRQEGGEAKVSFIATENWTASVINTKADSWISLDKTSGSAGSATIIITVQGNDTPDDRSATVQIKAGKTTIDIVVSQKGKDALTTTASKNEFGPEGGELTIEVKANIDFTYSIADGSKDWISESATKAMATTTLKFNIAENEGVERREGTITVKSSLGEEEIKIYQSGAEPTIVISQSEYSVKAEGETIQVEIRSNVNVEMVIPEDCDWIKEEETKSFSTNTFYLKVSENIQYEEREASITFSQRNGDLCDTIKINQAPKDLFYTNVSSFDVGVIGGVVGVEITHNIDITDISIEESAKSWIQQIETKGGSQTDIYSFQVKENETDNERKGIISFSYGANSKEIITITQLGNGIIQFSNNIVKYACVFKCDSDGDREVSRKEAATVSDLSDLFFETGYPMTEYSFNELKYFTSATNLPDFTGSKLTEITIPNSIKLIDGFRHSAQLKKVCINGSFSSLVIGDQAFEYCSSLEDINLPEGLVKIGNSAFAGCGKMTCSLPTTIEYIGSGAFSSESISFNSLVFPHSLAEIGNGAFEKVHFTGTTIFETNNAIIQEEAFKQANFQDIVFETNSVKFIGRGAFKETEIESVVLKNQEGLTIYDEAFFKSSLSKITFFERSVDYISYKSFSETHLRSVEIPAMKMLSGALNDCTYLEEAKFMGPIGDVGDVFRGCTALKSFKIPDWMTRIPDSMFEGCYALTDVEIPISTTQIGINTFKDCPFYKDGISMFSIPPQIESIGLHGNLNFVLNIIIEKKDGIFDIDANFEPPTYLYSEGPCKYTDFYVPSEFVEIYRNKYAWLGFHFYDVKEFPRHKPYESIPEGFVDMGLPTLWAKEDYDNGNAYYWPGTSMNYDNVRLPNHDDIDMLAHFSINTWQWQNSGYKILSPYTLNSITLIGNKWLSDGNAIGKDTRDNREKLGAVEVSKSQKLPIRMVYSIYNE